MPDTTNDEIQALKEGKHNLPRALAGTKLSSVRDKLRSLWPGTIRWDVPMAELSTLRVGGPAAAVIYPESAAELLNLLQTLGRLAVPWRLIGRGSNLLVADAGIAGVVIVLGRDFGNITRQGEERVDVEAGCSLAKLTTWCAGAGLSGLEFAVGIPGSVGGAVRMNAGAWGREMAEVVESARIIEMAPDSGGPAVESIPLCRDDFAYRSWRRPVGEIITSVVLRLTPGRPSEILARGRELIRQRQARQPKGVASAGSFFKNPPGVAAGRLIELAGLKGTTIGGAMVSEVHANFLVNTGRARASDFFDLMRLVQDRVRENCGTELEPEVEIINMDGTVK